MALDDLPFAGEMPKARFQENEKPNFLPMSFAPRLAADREGAFRRRHSIFQSKSDHEIGFCFQYKMIMKIERGGRVAAGFLSLVLCFEKENRGGIPCVAECNESQATGSAPVFLPPLFPHGWNRLGEGAGAPVKNFFRVFRVRERSERAGL